MRRAPPASKRHLEVLVIGLGVVIASGRARADGEPPAFGARHQVVIAVEHVAGVIYALKAFPGVDGTSSSSDLWLFGNSDAPSPYSPSGYAAPRVSADVFVESRLSLGLSASYARFSGPLREQLVLAPRVGYGAPLSPRFGIWPRVGLTYVHQYDENINLIMDPNFSVRSTLYALTLEVPLVFTVTPRFFLSVVPTFDVGLGGSIVGSGPPLADGTRQTSTTTSKQSDLGLQGGLGAYF